MRTAPMLILTRVPKESVMIGSDIVITVLSVAGNKVRIGIEAPRNIAVDREEVYERKRNERAEFKRDQDP